MRHLDCEFEEEVLGAVVQSRWPARADAHLLAHVAACQVCSDVAAVAAAMEQSRLELGPAPLIPDSGRVWWLAQMRARREAARAAGRPITLVQILAFACAVGLTGACAGATSVWFQEELRWLATKVNLETLLTHGLLLAAMAGLALVVPAAVYLVLRRE